MTVLREWTVPALSPNGEARETSVKVERHESEIIVRWVCGAVRAFPPDLLRAALDNFDAVVALGGDGRMRYHDADRHGHTYYAHLTDKGGFQANDSMTDGYIVPWDAFSAALRAAIPKPRKRRNDPAG